MDTGHRNSGFAYLYFMLEHFYIENRAISDSIKSEESVVTYDGDTFLMRKIDVNNDEYSVKEQIESYMMTNKLTPTNYSYIDGVLSEEKE